MLLGSAQQHPAHSWHWLFPTRRRRAGLGIQLTRERGGGERQSSHTNNRVIFETQATCPRALVYLGCDCGFEPVLYYHGQPN